MAAAGVRIKWNGGKVRLLGFGMQKYQMLKIGQAGLDDLKARVREGLGVNDAPMPPLKERRVTRLGNVVVLGADRGYKGFKAKIGKKPIRDLTLTGRMLANLSVRSASAEQVKIGLTSAKERQKALANERRAEWLGWSPRNIEVVMKEARRLFKLNVAALAQTLRGRTRRAA
jgi:hypothetical protein